PTMKRRRQRSKRVQIMHLWERGEVTKAVPYLRSVLKSLREHWLDAVNAQRRLDRAAAMRAPRKRQQIIENELQTAECERAQAKFKDAVEELASVDAFLVDPIRGLALIPFRKEDDLAWYIFDRFAKPGVIGWRYPNDPDEECRPLNQLKSDPASN